MSQCSVVRRLVPALAAAVAAIAAPAFAQQAAAPAPVSVQAAFVRDIGNLSDKFAALAGAMSGKYDWRPGPGVRSVSEVFNLIVTENRMLAGVLSGAAGQAPAGMGGGAAIADPAAMPDALRTSYAAVGQALSALSAEDMNASVRLFGRDTTKQGAVFILLLDQHEHLGQSIAYARTNGVVPPWSK